MKNAPFCIKQGTKFLTHLIYEFRNCWHNRYGNCLPSMKLFFFILTVIFLIIGKANANEIIIKDCYAVSKYGKNEFNTKRYTQYYYKIDPSQLRLQGQTWY